jgi:hypothetical protein
MTPPPAAASEAIHPSRTRYRSETAPGRPLTVPPRPRRVSGPARRPTRDQPARRRAAGQSGIALGLIAALDRLSRHRLPDRLTDRSTGSGRTWIAVVAFALIGIVTLQLGLLKLNAGIGRALEHEALLQRENAALSVENSELAAGDRIQARAAQMGMEFVAPGALRFLAARPRIDTTRGAAALSTPAHTSTTGSGETAAGPGTGAPQNASPPTAEPSTTASAASPSSSASPSSAESAPSASREPKTTSTESTTASAPPPSGTAPAGGSPAETAPSAETAPAGGTRTGPAG